MSAHHRRSLLLSIPLCFLSGLFARFAGSLLLLLQSLLCPLLTNRRMICCPE